MSAHEKKNQEDEQTQATQAEEQQNEREVKEAELKIEGLEDRIAPVSFTY